jgi:hypothetical protein
MYEGALLLLRSAARIEVHTYIGIGSSVIAFRNDLLTHRIRPADFYTVLGTAANGDVILTSVADVLYRKNSDQRSYGTLFSR